MPSLDGRRGKLSESSGNFQDHREVVRIIGKLKFMAVDGAVPATGVYWHRTGGVC